MTPNADDEAGQVVRKTESDFGVVYQLCAAGMVLDTYAPWNGDVRPAWMDLLQIDGSKT